METFSWECSVHIRSFYGAVFSRGGGEGNHVPISLGLRISIKPELKVRREALRFKAKT